MNELETLKKLDFSLITKNIDHAEKSFLNENQESCQVVHTFGPGQYIRELRVKAGTFIIGHHQNFEHMNIFVKGKVLMINDDGEPSVSSAPLMYVGKPGRKVGLVLEDMVWLNVYSTNDTDVETIESKIFSKSESFKANELLKKLSDKDFILKSREDYLKTIAELGFTEDQVKYTSEDTSDLISVHFGAQKTKISDSEISGKGIFATADIDEGEEIGLARVNGKRTVYGRYVNHSILPNARMEAIGNGDVKLVATKKISGSFGGMSGDEITINYKQAFYEGLKYKEGGLCLE